MNHTGSTLDYKPAYGFIFQKELQGYEYWGYCDLDIVLGKLDAFITDRYLAKFDKIFTLGHMSIFRNVDEVNNVFLKSYKNSGAKYQSYKEVLQKEKNDIMARYKTANSAQKILIEKEMIKSKQKFEILSKEVDDLAEEIQKLKTDSNS